MLDKIDLKGCDVDYSHLLVWSPDRLKKEKKKTLGLTFFFTLLITIDYFLYMNDLYICLFVFIYALCVNMYR